MRTSSLCFLVLFFPSLLLAENWPGWRGPGGMGHSTAKNPPLEWDRKTNVRWKVALSGPGNSSPIVWGDRVFLVHAFDKGAKRSVLCYDRAKGTLLWQKDTPYKDPEPTHNTNPPCSATPVTDGERVVASLGSAGMVCYDFAGKELWRKETGKQHHIWGNASSPILHKNLAILWCGPGEKQFLLAVDKTTGKTVWQHDEPGGKFGNKGETWVGSWSTPIVVKVADREELILSVPHKVKGFDPATGKELWSCDGLGPLVYTSPVCSESGIVAAFSGYGGPALAVRAGGSGDVTKTHRLWVTARGQPQRIGSAVVVGEHAFLISEPGQGHCFDLKTGKDLWERKRVSGQTWSSLVLAGGRLYITGMGGATLVLAADTKEPKELAQNKLGERTLSTPAFTPEGEIFIRTYEHLWCIAAVAATK